MGFMLLSCFNVEESYSVDIAATILDVMICLPSLLPLHVFHFNQYRNSYRVKKKHFISFNV